MLKISAGPAASDLGALKTPGLAILLDQASGPPSFGALDTDIVKAVQRVMSRRDFRSGRDETMHLLGTEGGVDRVLLVGMGKVTDRRASLRRASALAARRAAQAGFGRLAIFAGDVSADDA